MNFKKIWGLLLIWFSRYFIFLLIAAISILLAVLSFRKAYYAEQEVDNFKAILTTILEHKSDSLPKIDSISKRLIELKFQQETYTQMLDRQSDWFIMYVSILFLIVSIFGFVVSTKTISNIKRKNNRDYDKQKKVHADFVSEIKNLQFELYTTFAHNSEAISKDELDEWDKFHNSLTASLYLYKSHLINKELIPTERVVGSLEDSLKILQNYSIHPADGQFIYKYGEYSGSIAMAIDFLLKSEKESVKMLASKINALLDEV